jgi:hypothetical protein
MNYPKKVIEKDPINIKQFRTQYQKHLYNLLTSIPVLLILGGVVYSLSFFSSQRETKLSAYLDKASKWNEQGLSEKLSSIRLLARIMPSQNTEKNVLYMDWVSMTTDTEGKDAASSQSYYYNKSLHIYNNTKDYFPTLNLNPEFVPVGDSKTLCVNLAWAPSRMWRVYEMYHQVSNQPECSQAQNSKFRW